MPSLEEAMGKVLAGLHQAESLSIKDDAIGSFKTVQELKQPI